MPADLERHPMYPNYFWSAALQGYQERGYYLAQGINPDTQRSTFNNAPVTSGDAIQFQSGAGGSVQSLIQGTGANEGALDAINQGIIDGEPEPGPETSSSWLWIALGALTKWAGFW